MQCHVIRRGMQPHNLQHLSCKPTRWISTERQATLLVLPSLHPTKMALMREVQRCTDACHSCNRLIPQKEVPCNAKPSGMECTLQILQHLSCNRVLDIYRAPRNTAVPPKPASNNDRTHEKYRDAPMQSSHAIHILHQEVPSNAMPSGMNANSTPCNNEHAAQAASHQPRGRLGEPGRLIRRPG